MKHSFHFIPITILLMALVLEFASGPRIVKANTESATQFRNRRAQIEEKIRQAEARVFSNESEAAYDTEKTKFGMASLMRHDS